MGLLLSILVSCVGVVELIAFYSNLRRNFRITNHQDSDLDTITSSYKKMLTKENKQTEKEVHIEVKTNYALRPSPKAIFHSEDNQKQSTNTKEETLEVNTSKSVVVEVDNPPKLEPNDCETDPAQSENYNFEHIANDIEHDIRDTNIIYLERGIPAFDVEHEINHFPMYENPYFESEPMQTDTFIFIHEPNHIIIENADEECSSNIDTIYILEEPFIDPIHGDRCPSPFPTYETLVPRNSRGSISSELLENSIINVMEVEDENCIETELNDEGRWRPRSRSRSKHRSRSSSRHRIPADVLTLLSPLEKLYTQRQRYRRNRSLSPLSHVTEDVPFNYLQKRRRSKSSSDLCKVLCCRSELDYQVVAQDYWRRCPSPFEQLVSDNNQYKTQQFVLVEEIFSDEFKNSLDGVKPKNPNEKRKQDFKRKRNNRSSQSSMDSTSDSRENLQSICYPDVDTHPDTILTENLLESKTIYEESNGKISELLSTPQCDSLSSAHAISSDPLLIHDVNDINIPTMNEQQIESNASVKEDMSLLLCNKNAIDEHFVIAKEINGNEPSNLQTEVNGLLIENTISLNLPSNTNDICKETLPNDTSSTDDKLMRKENQDDIINSDFSTNSSKSVDSEEAVIVNEQCENKYSSVVEVRAEPSVSVKEDKISADSSVLSRTFAKTPTKPSDAVSNTHTKEDVLPAILVSSPTSEQCAKSTIIKDCIEQSVIIAPQIESNFPCEENTPASHPLICTSINQEEFLKDNNVKESVVQNLSTTTKNEATKTKDDSTISKPGPSNEKKKPEPFWVN